MKTIHIIITLFLVMSTCEVNSQSDLFVDPSSIGLTFLDGKKYEECKVCKEDITYLDDKI